MKRHDRVIVAGLALAGLVAAFWFLALSPKREEAADLQDRVTELEASVAKAEQVASAAGEARKDFDENYHRLVVLGKAVPETSDSASMLDEVDELADGAGIQFREIVLETGSAAPVPPPALTTTDQAQESEAGESEEAAAAAAVAATESAVAAAPIGASVGPAGLSVLPYELTFRGGFFDVADYIASLDRLVRSESKTVGVDGRLITIDGFTLVPDPVKGFPNLEADLLTSTYTTPASQGLTAGATPGAPAASVPPATTPTSTATP